MEATFEWPAGYRSTVVLSFDVDAESALIHRDPEALKNRLGLLEERRYGPRVGLPRILRMLRERSLPATFFVPAYTARTYPDALEQILTDGHEIACHGDEHEPLAPLSAEREEEILVRQIDELRTRAGSRPIGYRSPSWDLNLRTPELLKRHGFAYDSSLMGNDRPYLLPTALGPLVEIPVQWFLDDAPYYRHVYGAPNQFAEPDRVIRTWLNEFDALHEEGGCLVVTMHPWITGRAGRLAALGRLLDAIQSRPDVWISSCAEVASWAARALAAPGHDGSGPPSS